MIGNAIHGIARVHYHRYILSHKYITVEYFMVASDFSPIGNFYIWTRINHTFFPMKGPALRFIFDAVGFGPGLGEPELHVYLLCGSQQ